MNRTSEKVVALYRACGFSELTPEAEHRLKEAFITFYSQYDRRLLKCNRDRINVVVRPDHTARLTTVYYKTAYGQVYNITQEDIK